MRLSALERSLGYPEKNIVGLDEVGRGCLAGPVVAAAVVLPSEAMGPTRPKWLSRVADSKELDVSEREELAPLIREWCRDSAVGVASVTEINEINIYHASHLAMFRAWEQIRVRIDYSLVDGKYPPKQIPEPVTAIVKGDSKCLSIACASIIAKVWRDQRMAELDSEIPGYGFASHKGYPTKQHLDSLQKLGVTPIHRRGFRPVADLAK